MTFPVITPKLLKLLFDLVEDFNLKSIDDTDSINNNSYGKIKKTDRLIVMDSDSGLADCSNLFAKFLMVTRNFGYHCVYIFHVILQEKNI